MNSDNLLNRILAFIFILTAIPILIFKPIFVAPSELKELKELLAELYSFEWDFGVIEAIENVSPIYEFNEENREKFWNNFQSNSIQYQTLPEYDRRSMEGFDFVNFIKPRLMRIVKERKMHMVSFDNMPDKIKMFKMEGMGYIYNKQVSEMAVKLSNLRSNIEEAQKFQELIQNQLEEGNRLEPVNGLLESAIEIILASDSAKLIGSIPLYKPIVYLSMNHIASILEDDIPEEYRKMVLDIIKDPNEDLYIKKISLEQLMRYSNNADEEMTQEILTLLEKEIYKRKEYYHQVVSKESLTNQQSQTDTKPESEYLKALIKLANAFASSQEQDVIYSVPKN